MGRGSSKIGGAGGSGATAKSFNEMSVEEKKQAIKAEETRLDNTFKHYEYNGYKIYNIGGQYAAYKFNGLSDNAIKKMQNLSYLAVLYDKTLKKIKAQL